MAVLVLAVLLGAAGVARSASPAGGTPSPSASATGRIAWTGSVSAGPETLASGEGAACFGSNRKPDPASGCDFFRLDVSVPAGFWRDHPGVVHVNGTGFGVADLDMYIYRRNADGTHGAFEAGDGEVAGSDENVSIGRRAARTTSS